MSARLNNFDFIRLFAASQVLILHSVHHLGLENKGDWPSEFYKLLSLFPGVPIFFGLSGFLITQTFLRKPTLGPYIRNRALRIFPGLWACFLVTVGILAFFGFVNESAWQQIPFWTWVAGQITFFQFYTPDFLRDFGVGSPNGSLWTIVVELQFYALVPLLWYVAGRTPKRFWNAFTALAIAGLIGAALMPKEDSLWEKLAGVTIIPYLPFFWLGATFCVFQESLLPMLKGKGGWWLLGYSAFALYFGYYTKQYTISYFPDVFSRLGLAFLLATCFACAYTAQDLSSKWLRGVDISYGIYVYHAPLIGLVIEAGLPHSYATFWCVILGSTLLALASWFWVEKPALNLKRAS